MSVNTFCHLADFFETRSSDMNEAPGRRLKHIIELEYFRITIIFHGGDPIGVETHSEKLLRGSPI